jgi:hypothetical protein
MMAQLVQLELQVLMVNQLNPVPTPAVDIVKISTQ